jgi:SAM-dependent methyltransferase
MLRDRRTDISARVESSAVARNRVYAMARPPLPLTRHLSGTGLELGPFFQPFPVDTPGTRVRYVERYTVEENRALFPEWGGATFQRPDLVADLDRERLGMIRSGSVDFVIACHVLEHLAEPLGMIDEIHRVLVPGGTVLIALPDRSRCVDDQRRHPPSIEHLAEEFRTNVTHVSDEHVEEYLQALTIADDDPGRALDYDVWRSRSIHVHVWDEREFLEVLEYCVSTLGHDWEFVDGVATDDPGQATAWEFAYLLRRSPYPLGAETRLEQFRFAVRQWQGRYDAACALRVRLDAAESEIGAIRASNSWRVTAPMRRISRRLKSRPASTR